MILNMLTILGLAFVQNVSFSMVSRSRNRDNVRYHIITSLFSNSIWFLTFRQLVLADMSIKLIPFYVLGTVIGSVSGVKISMFVERILHASADGHIRRGK